jgi:hypothetical protein
LSRVGQELLNVPFDEMVSKLAIAIAEGQLRLDAASLEITKAMGDVKRNPVSLPNILVDSKGELIDEEDPQIITSMIGAGFQPTFYQFTDTIIEVKMAISMERETEYETKSKGKRTTYSRTGNWFYSRTRITSTPVDARYSSTYSYHVEGSSLLRTKITPVPPNQFMQKILDMKAEAIRMQFELKIKEAELALAKKREDVDKKLVEADEKGKIPA